MKISGKIAEQYCKKGAKVYLEGQLQTREFTDKEGNQRKTTEVVLQRFRGELTLLDSRSRGGEDSAYGGASGGSFGRQSPMERAPASGGSGGFGGGAGGFGRPGLGFARRRHSVLRPARLARPNALHAFQRARVFAPRCRSPRLRAALM